VSLYLFEAGKLSHARGFPALFEGGPLLGCQGERRRQQGRHLQAAPKTVPLLASLANQSFAYGPEFAWVGAPAVVRFAAPDPACLLNCP
jgi:hypothetical protein